MNIAVKTGILPMLLLLLQGACASKPLIYSYGQPEVATQSTAWANPTQDEWKNQKNRDCITHLYRCDFDEQGQVTGIQALDVSQAEFKDLTEESLRRWTFQPGKAGHCFVDFVYTPDTQTRMILLPKDLAERVARTRAEERSKRHNSKKTLSVKQVKPLYPKDALMRREIGLVHLRFDVSQEGVPERIRVMESRPDKVFDRVSLTALRQWRYKPLAEDPGTIRTDVDVTFYFTLEGMLGYSCPLAY